MPAAPTESAQAPDAVIALSAVEFEERRLELVVTKDATHFRIPFGARIPRGWGPTVLPGQAAVDGSEGIAAFSAPSDTGAGPDIAFSASICAKCTAEEAHARQEELAARTGSKVLKTERIEPGRTLLIEEHNGERTAVASRTLTGGSLAVFQCIVAGLRRPYGMSSWRLARR